MVYRIAAIVFFILYAVNAFKWVSISPLVIGIAAFVTGLALAFEGVVAYRVVTR